MKKQKQFQGYQGDIGLIKVDKLPEGAKKAGSGTGMTLAYGEVTGHHHSLYGPYVTRFEVQENDELVSYVEIAEALASLEHQEHGTITVEPGVYKVIRQYEYVPGDFPQQVLD